MPSPANTKDPKEKSDLENRVSATSKNTERHRKGSERFERGRRRRCIFGSGWDGGLYTFAGALVVPGWK
jgi:hypothetical protein